MLFLCYLCITFRFVYTQLRIIGLSTKTELLQHDIIKLIPIIIIIMYRKHKIIRNVIIHFETTEYIFINIYKRSTMAFWLNNYNDYYYC